MATVSIEKVENVVNAPSTPVTSANRQTGSSPLWCWKKNNATPAAYAPSQLAANVPQGSQLCVVWSHKAKRHRSNAPAQAPRQMASTVVKASHPRAQ